MDEDGNGKFRLESVNQLFIHSFISGTDVWPVCDKPQTVPEQGYITSPGFPLKPEHDSLCGPIVIGGGPNYRVQIPPMTEIPGLFLEDIGTGLVGGQNNPAAFAAFDPIGDDVYDDLQITFNGTEPFQMQYQSK